MTDYNDFTLGDNATVKMDETEARAKLIALFVGQPGASFTLTEFADVRRDKYGQDRQWGRDLLDELTDAGLLVRIADVKDEGDEFGEPAYEVTDSTFILDQWS